MTLTAEDGDDNSTTETFSINVTDTNVAIVEDDDDPVVTINGTASGLGHITMSFGADQDPDLDEPLARIRFWCSIPGATCWQEDDDASTTEVDESMEADCAHRSAPHHKRLLLDADRDQRKRPSGQEDHCHVSSTTKWTRRPRRSSCPRIFFGPNG